MNGEQCLHANIATKSQIRGLTTQLASYQLKNRKLSQIIKNLKKEHKKQIDQIQHQFQQLQMQLLDGAVIMQDIAVQTEELMVECRPKANNISEAIQQQQSYLSIFDEINKTLPYLYDADSFTGNGEQQKEVNELVDDEILNSQIAAENISVLSCKKIKRLQVGKQLELQQQNQSNLQAEGKALRDLQSQNAEQLFAFAEDEPPGGDHLLEEIDLQPDAQIMNNRRAILQNRIDSKMKQSLYQRMSESNQLHVSRARLQ